MKCAYPCGEEFEPKRSNQVYVNAKHRKRDSNRRWPVKRQSGLPEASRDGLSERREAKISHVTLLRGTKMAHRKKRPQFLTSAEVVDFLRIGKRTLERWRTKRTGPPFVRMTRSNVRYRRCDLESWLTSLSRT